MFQMPQRSDPTSNSLWEGRTAISRDGQMWLNLVTR